MSTSVVLGLGGVGLEAKGCEKQAAPTLPHIAPASSSYAGWRLACLDHYCFVAQRLPGQGTIDDEVQQATTVPERLGIPASRRSFDMALVPTTAHKGGTKHAHGCFLSYPLSLCIISR